MLDQQFFFNSFKTLFKTCKQGAISVILKTYCAASIVEIALGVGPKGINSQSKRQLIKSKLG